MFLSENRTHFSRTCSSRRVTLARMIRPATCDDLTAVRECAETAYASYIPRIGKKPAPMIADFAAQIADGLVHVYDMGGTPAGFIVFYPREDHLHIENVAVHPDRQGHGIGRALINFAEQHARNEGYRTMELYTNAKMTENLTYYPSLGYVEIGRWSEDGFDRVFFRKKI